MPSLSSPTGKKDGVPIWRMDYGYAKAWWPRVTLNGITASRAISAVAELLVVLFLPCDCMQCDARYCFCNSVHLFVVCHIRDCDKNPLNDALGTFWYHTKGKNPLCVYVIFTFTNLWQKCMTNLWQYAASITVACLIMHARCRNPNCKC